MPAASAGLASTPGVVSRAVSVANHTGFVELSAGFSAQ
jgi:hypothetical protein